MISINFLLFVMVVESVCVFVLLAVVPSGSKCNCKRSSSLQVCVSHKQNLDLGLIF